MLIRILLAISLCLFVQTALPNPAEASCTRACLLRSPFGGCRVRGPCTTIPIPEPPAPPPIDKCVRSLRECDLDKIPHAEIVQRCIAKPGECPEQIIKSFPAEVAGPIVDSYLRYLSDQARDKTQRLSPSFIADFRAYYPELDLADVRYATGITTVHGQAITIGDTIYFPDAIDLDSVFDRELMVHEIRHVVQYRNKGGVKPFISEYILHAIGKFGERGSFDIHDFIGTERDAISFAQTVMSRSGRLWKVTNRCSSEVSLAISYYNGSEWVTEAWWDLRPGFQNTLKSDDMSLQSINRAFYWYAETADGTAISRGNSRTNVEGEIFNFEERRTPEDQPWHALSFCG